MAAAAVSISSPSSATSGVALAVCGSSVRARADVPARAGEGGGTEPLSAR
jgi:hypothetical protein